MNEIEQNEIFPNFLVAYFSVTTFKIEFTVYIPKKSASTNWKTALAPLQPSRLFRIIQRLLTTTLKLQQSHETDRTYVNVIFAHKTRKCAIKNLIKIKVQKISLLVLTFTITSRDIDWENSKVIYLGKLARFLRAECLQNKFSDLMCSHS